MIPSGGRTRTSKLGVNSCNHQARKPQRYVCLTTIKLNPTTTLRIILDTFHLPVAGEDSFLKPYNHYTEQHILLGAANTLSQACFTPTQHLHSFNSTRNTRTNSYTRQTRKTRVTNSQAGTNESWLVRCSPRAPGFSHRIIQLLFKHMDPRREFSSRKFL